MSESISNERLSKRNLWGYSMGGIGRDMAYQLVNTYLLTFITFTKGLSNTEFAMVGVIMVICRIFDGCNDPFMGSLIEITRTKIGKFKPWILAGVFTNVAVIIALFCVLLASLILRITVYNESLFMNYLTSLLLGLACAALFYTRRFRNSKKDGKLYTVITVLLAIMAVIYGGMGLLGLLTYFGIV